MFTVQGQGLVFRFLVDSPPPGVEEAKWPPVRATFNSASAANQLTGLNRSARCSLFCFVQLGAHFLVRAADCITTAPTKAPPVHLEAPAAIEAKIKTTSNRKGQKKTAA